MNLMSSIAKTLVGSVIASVSVVPDLADRNDVVLGGGLGRNQPDDRRIEIEFAEVDGRHAVLPAERPTVMSSSARMPSLTRLRPEPAAVGALMVQRLLQLGRGDALFAQQQFAESDSHVLLAGTRPPGDVSLQSGRAESQKPARSATPNPRSSPRWPCA